MMTSRDVHSIPKIKVSLIYNHVVHILCETCNEIICDKCEYTRHKNHKTESFGLTIDSNYIINLFTMSSNIMKTKEKEQLANFKEVLSEHEKVVEKFFTGELLRVESATKEIINLLTTLQQKIKKLISLYQNKFKEKFNHIKQEYDNFSRSVQNGKYLLLRV